VVNLIVFLSGDVQVHFMSSTIWEHCNLTVKSWDVVKFATINPLLLISLCKLSFPIVGLEMASLPTLALKSLNKICI
jgi:hypothetical protein